MAVATLALPQWVQQDGRGIFMALEANNNLFCWPNNNNGACISLNSQYSGGAASHTVTVGPEVSPAAVIGSGISGSGYVQLIEVVLDNLGTGKGNAWFWMPANIALNMPAPISQAIASTAGTAYTIT